MPSAGSLVTTCAPHNSSCGEDYAFLDIPFTHRHPVFPAGFCCSCDDSIYSRGMGIHAAKPASGKRFQALSGRRARMPDPGSGRHVDGLPGDPECGDNQFHPNRCLQRRHGEPPLGALLLYHSHCAIGCIAGCSHRQRRQRRGAAFSRL